MNQKRAIFEEVGTGPAETKAPAATGAIDGGPQALARWHPHLAANPVCACGDHDRRGRLTRLTDSGLSITEWRPVTGALPPMSAAEWDAEFDKYRAIPEYQLQNKGMSLAEFKVIYWWEWGHRQLGRVIGLVWASVS